MVNRIIYPLSSNSLGYIEYKNENNRHHRLNGPARIWGDGTFEWYLNGRLHRSNGPAIGYTTYGDINEWWYHGKEIYCKDLKEFNKLIKLIVLME